MKKIPKKLLDSLIYIDRLYWKSGEFDLLAAANALCFEIQNECGLEWSAIRNFISSIAMNNGLSSKADNETIYEVLKLLGWEVSGEDEKSESL